jgi:ppGpp synthetase/RelA/SpoT-type nucleotidyltranferase
MKANGVDVNLGVLRAPTWIAQIPVPDVVAKFLRQYTPIHYESMARRASQILEEKLYQGGVQQFKISDRAKDKKSLKEKLIVRHEEKNYQDADDIKKDVIDLAGVRIILYMPTKEEYRKVKNVIQEEWGKEIKPKHHPPPHKQEVRENGEDGENEESEEDSKRKKKYKPVHLGYRAIHYRCPMKEEQSLKHQYEWLENDMVEVQVVSALTHAWAEVGHDILYKSYAYGPPTFQERRTLDALNGLVQSGDLLLEQFQDMLNKRTSTRFEHRAELTVFFNDFYAVERELIDESNVEDLEEEKAQFPKSEGLYILYKFLKKENKNYPMAVRKALKELQYPYEHHQKERLIIQSFRPVPQLAPDMSTVVCLIRHLLVEVHHKPTHKGLSARDLCATMMSALTMLQYSLGSAEKANRYLQTTKMTAAEVESINFLLDSNKRHATLQGRHDEDIVKPSLEKAWTWFQNQAKDPESLCGLLFWLAEMGCRKELNPPTQIDQLQIGPLSRSSTVNMDNDPVTS